MDSRSLVSVVRVSNLETTSFCSAYGARGIITFLRRLAFIPSQCALPWRICPFIPFGCNSRDRASVTQAKRGKGAQPKVFEEGQEKAPAERRVAMAGFCSCKTGIHAIHGKNLGAAPETRLWHRHGDMSGLRRGAADHRPYPKPRGDQEDSILRSVNGASLHHSSHPPRHQRRLHSTRPATAL